MTTLGRRIPYSSTGDPYTAVTQPGDYYGPDQGEYSAGIPAVWFLLPTARDVEEHLGGRSLHHVQSPPHKFYEEPDGTLTIRESIGAGPRGQYYWHGYLTKGQWELEKSHSQAADG